MDAGPSRPVRKGQRTIAELAKLGELSSTFDRSLPIKAWVKSAEALYKEAQSCDAEGDLETAFIHLVKAAKICIDVVPSHVDYPDLSKKAKGNIQKDAHLYMDELGHLKLALLARPSPSKSSSSSSGPPSPSSPSSLRRSGKLSKRAPTPTSLPTSPDPSNPYPFRSDPFSQPFPSSSSARPDAAWPVELSDGRGERMSVAMASLNVDERTGEREGGAIQYVRPENVTSLDSLSRPSGSSSYSSASSRLSSDTATPTETTPTTPATMLTGEEAYPSYASSEAIEYNPPPSRVDRGGGLGLFKTSSRTGSGASLLSGKPKQGSSSPSTEGGRKRRISLGGWRSSSSTSVPSQTSPAMPSSSSMSRDPSSSSAHSTASTSSTSSRRRGSKSSAVAGAVKNAFSVPAWTAPGSSSGAGVGMGGNGGGRQRRVSLTDPGSWSRSNANAADESSAVAALAGLSTHTASAPTLPLSPTRISPSNPSTPRPRHPLSPTTTTFTPRPHHNHHVDDPSAHRMSAAHLEQQGYFPPSPPGASVDRRASVRSSRMGPIVYPSLAPGMSTGVSSKDRDRERDRERDRRKSKYSGSGSGSNGGKTYVAASTNLVKNGGTGVSYPSLSKPAPPASHSAPSIDPFARASMRPPPPPSHPYGDPAKPLSEFARSAEAVRVLSETEAAVKGMGKFRSEGGKELVGMMCPEELVGMFVALAEGGTERGIETCGLLLGILKHGLYRITTLLVPKQEATADTCSMTHEDEVFGFQASRDLMTLGWIHTHPTQTCFMSSLDLHTHVGYQMMLPEAVAIVCSPRSQPSVGVFRLTDPPGIQTISTCKRPGAFHPHPPGVPIYTDADGGHLRLAAGLPLEVVDLRE